MGSWSRPKPWSRSRSGLQWVPCWTPQRGSPIKQPLGDLSSPESALQGWWSTGNTCQLWPWSVIHFYLIKRLKIKSNACVSHPDSDRAAAVTESKADVLTVPPKQMSSALGSLLANYGSMSESDSNDEPEGKFASTLNQSTIRIYLYSIRLDP